MGKENSPIYINDTISHLKPLMTFKDGNGNEI